MNLVLFPIFKATKVYGVVTLNIIFLVFCYEVRF